MISSFTNSAFAWRRRATCLGALLLLFAASNGPRAEGPTQESRPAPEASKAVKPAAASSSETRTRSESSAAENGPTGVHSDAIAWNPKSAAIVTLAGQSVQLATNPPTYLHITVALEISRESAKEELTAAKAEFQDSVERIVRSTPPQNLLRLEGKLEIKRKLLRSANRIMKSGVARDIYITDFAIKDVQKL